MANIYCTKKLEKILGKKLIEEEGEPSPLGNWNPNVFYVSGKKCLLMMNDKSYYSIVLINIQKKDFLNFHNLFIERFLQQLDNDNIEFPYAATPKIMNNLAPHFLKTNNNRKVLGTMKEALQMAEYIINNAFHGNVNFIDLDVLNTKLNNTLIGALGLKKHDYGSPNVEKEKGLKLISAEN